MWIFSMYKHLSSSMHELWPALDPHTITLPWASHVYLFRDISTNTPISSHCAVQWVGAIRHSRSSFWKIKAGLPAEPSLISKGRLPSENISALFWWGEVSHCYDRWIIILGDTFFASIIWWASSFFLPATFVHLWFPCDFRHRHKNLRMTSGLLLLEIFKHVCVCNDKR